MASGGNAEGRSSKSEFVLRDSGFFRHSSFGLRHFWSFLGPSHDPRYAVCMRRKCSRLPIPWEDKVSDYLAILVLCGCLTVLLWKFVQRRLRATRTPLGFLDAHSPQLANFVLSLNPEKRLDLLFQCLDEFPREIRNDPRAAEAITTLKDTATWTRDKAGHFLKESDWLFALSIEADEAGNDEESSRLDQIGSILAAVATAMKQHPLSAQSADNCLYFMNAVLTKDFIHRLLSQSRNAFQRP